MSIARFSPFELLLLKSRSQVDTATLLLLAWVLVHRQHVSEGQRRRRLAQVTAQFRHGHELGPVMSIARSQDLQAIQLAAEVVRKECGTERSLSVIHQAITVATDDGELSLANHYILRFLADLLSIAPMTLNTLFKELTGTPLATPEDPSRDAYWQAHDPDYHARKAREAEAAEQYHQQANARAEQQQQQKERRHQQKQQKQQEKQQRQEQARQAREQEQQRQREQTRQQEQERQRQQQQRTAPLSPARFSSPASPTRASPAARLTAARSHHSGAFGARTYPRCHPGRGSPRLSADGAAPPSRPLLFGK